MRSGCTTSDGAAGPPVTLADVPDDEWDDVTPARRRRRLADGRVGAQRRGARLALALADAALAVVPRRAARPHRRRRRRLGVLHPRATWSTPRFGGRAGLAAAARRWLAARRRGCSSTSCPTTSPPTTPGSTTHPEYFVRGDADDLAATRRVPRGRRRGHRPRPRPVLPALAGRRPARRVRARAARRGRRRRSSTIGDAGRRRALRHGDADARRRLRAHMGRPRPAPRPTSEYWTDVIARGAAAATRTSCSSAEAYWDLECAAPTARASTTATTSGSTTACSTRAPTRCAGTSRADLGYQRHLVRFVENHDEPRAAAEFDRGRRSAPPRSSSPPCPARRCGTRVSSRAGGCASRCSSAADPRNRSTRSCRAFHHRARRCRHGLRRGEWALCEATGWPEDSSCEQLWRGPGPTTEQRTLVVVNYADAPAAAMVHVPWDDLAGRTWRLDDLLGGAIRAGDDVTSQASTSASTPERSTSCAGPQSRMRSCPNVAPATRTGGRRPIWSPRFFRSVSSADPAARFADQARRDDADVERVSPFGRFRSTSAIWADIETVGDQMALRRTVAQMAAVQWSRRRRRRGRYDGRSMQRGGDGARALQHGASPT